MKKVQKQLWKEASRPQGSIRPGQKKLSSAYSLSASEQDKQNLGEASWLDWQRERWQIWELLSTDNPDALPETLV